MPRLRAPPNLTCFYCGRRTGKKYDGSLREFLCTNCEATNYLDENGDITDPPVATEREAPAAQYATSRKSAAPSSSQQDSIFCATCIKNQRLFTASLAQYLPDDPSHPDYPKLERESYRYRRSLEKRYPQVCDSCADKVDGCIRQAGYTAKTDHLRRMMDRSRGQKALPRTSGLDWVNGLGLWLWRGGFVLQMLWHLVIVADALGKTDDGMYDPDDESLPTKAIAALKSAAGYMPQPEMLIRWSLTVSILSVWWNPHFVQVNRGFTRHLLGFTQWYSFQGLIIFFRFVFRRVLELQGGEAQSRYALLSAHTAMAAVMILMYFLAGRSIRIDTTPLFGAYEGTVSPKQARSPEQKKHESEKTFSDLVNEALDSPDPTPQKPPIGQMQANSHPPRHLNDSLESDSPSFRIGSLGLGDGPPQQEQIHYDDEMDWVPTQSQHRAFSNTDTNTGSSRPLQFGHAPTKPDGGTFWFKTPAAPVSPAHQLRNPPNAPVLKSKPADKANPFFRERSRSKGGARAQKSSGVSFRQPQFFASQPENDETNSLVDMFSESFNFSQEPDEGVQGASKPSMWQAAGARPVRPDPWIAAAVETCVSIVLILIWRAIPAFDIPYPLEARVATLAVAGALSLGHTDQTLKELLARSQSVPSFAAYASSALGVAELAALCWVGWEAWKGPVDATDYVYVVFMVMPVRGLWNAWLRARA